jgi:RNA polymerase sigma-70 factor, ECF subfamily
MRPDNPTLTQALTEWRNGDQDAGNRLFAAAYQELRRLAAWHLQRERPGHTLQATALVNELYLKLFGREPVDWQNRAHFFAVAAQQIRRLLVDYARAGLAEKRGGDRVKLSLTEVKGLAAPERARPARPDDTALSRLETLDPRACRVVEMRYFGGATEQETAEAVGVSVATVKRDWEFARTWLISQLKPKN